MNQNTNFETKEYKSILDVDQLFKLDSSNLNQAKKHMTTTLRYDRTNINGYIPQPIRKYNSINNNFNDYPMTPNTFIDPMKRSKIMNQLTMYNNMMNFNKSTTPGIYDQRMPTMFNTSSLNILKGLKQSKANDFFAPKTFYDDPFFVPNYDKMFISNNNTQTFISDTTNAGSGVYSHSNGKKLFTMNGLTNINQQPFTHSLVRPEKRTFTTGSSEQVKKEKLISKDKSKGFIKDERNDEFRNEEFFNLNESKFCEYIKTQRGSRTAQRFLNKISPENLNKVLFKISSFLLELMCDSYSNYFIQKVFQCCSSNQRLIMLKSMEKDIRMLSFDSSGTHSLQALIEIINLEEEEAIFENALKESVLELSLHSNGTHVIQKLITCVDELKRGYINNVLLSNLRQLCFNANGICVIKKFIISSKCTEMRDKLMEFLKENCLELVQDSFGNYAIQYAVEVWKQDYTSYLINTVLSRFMALSKQKISSNVVEKCLEALPNENLVKISTEIFNESNFILLLKNKYGNFVLQKLVCLLDDKTKKRIKEFLINVNIKGVKELSRLKALKNSL